MKLKLLVLVGLAAVAAAAPSRALGGEVSGKIVVRVSRTSADVVVSLLPKGFAPPLGGSQGSVVLDQRGKEFVPHVLPIKRGGEVTFFNSDDFLHNIHAYHRRKEAFNVAMPPIKPSKWGRTFTEAGVVTLLCDVHPEMSAFIVVLETPWFAKTGTDGTFVIQNVPPGEYTLRTWHEKAKAREMPIRVGSRVTNVHLELGR